MVANIVFVVLLLSGFGLTVAGAAMVYVPAAYILSGLAALKLAREVAK